MGKNLVKEKYPSEEMKPGQPKREDDTYEKKGSGNVFIACEPLAGKRYLQVSKRRTRKDWARFMHELLAEHYPQADKVVIVMDNLNTHSPASLNEVFPPQQAKALADRLEIHYTPKHASWLNIATMQEFCEQVEQWQTARNQLGTTVRWQFTTAEARIKLERLYPLYKKTSDTRSTVSILA
jgi:hypothetical protein